MAAGMGSRYGGLKQIDPIDEEGHIIMDFSMFDAKRAGFEKVIFIIKKENEEDFKAAVGDRMAEYMDVSYAFQELSNIPEGYEVPEGRVKPWGTAHAVLSCIDQIDGPFAVINADDYYGVEAFKLIYDYLESHPDDDKYRYTMVGYYLGNTVTDNGHVARGICTMDENGRLVKIEERTQIEKRDGGIAFTEDGGETWTNVSEKAVVSMNMWGLTPDFMEVLEKGFAEFLSGLAPQDTKKEYLLPELVDHLIKNESAEVDVLETKDTWFGVTYQEDKETVMRAFKNLTEAGIYPQGLYQ